MLGKKNLILIFIFSLLTLSLNLESWGQSTSEAPKKEGRRESRQAYFMVGSFREVSDLVRTSDDTLFKINTLNTVGRIGLTHYLGRAKYFLRYGVLLGQSANASATTQFAYFQRSVFLAGVDGALGLPLFLGKGVELSATAGGLLRYIQHTAPSGDYEFKTQIRFLPQLTLEYLWRLSTRIYWKQGVGTQGTDKDTYWTAGFGFDW